ncbi:hypothetical protein [Longimicrobium sp.]|uniref:hypothetical protein n=1 Tax=Longimicrobium sp. TaxID=2029185 RepID=UPI003B3B8B1B
MIYFLRTGIRWPLLGVVLLAAAMAGPAAAQSSAADLAAGTRVRVVESGSDRVVGTVSGVRGDTLLVFAGGREHMLAISSIRSLQVSRGPSPRLTSALEGGLVGLLAGGAAGAAVAVLGDAVGGDGECDSGGDLLCFSTGEWALVGVVVGAPVGAASGAVARFLSPRERWRRVEPAANAPRLSVQSGSGGLRIGFSVPTS